MTPPACWQQPWLLPARDPVRARRSRPAQRRSARTVPRRGKPHRGVAPCHDPLRPHDSARNNLLREGIEPACVHVTGNTVIDALLQTAKRDWPLGVRLDPRKRLVLVTVHRRESFGDPLEQICKAIAELHDRHPEVEFLWPLHPNPAVKMVVPCLLSAYPRALVPRRWNTARSSPRCAGPPLCSQIRRRPGRGTRARQARARPEERKRASEAIELGVARLLGTIRVSSSRNAHGCCATRRPIGRWCRQTP